VKPANDLLPSPIATLITGITPQDALRDGITEADAFALINDEMARPGTCSAGYNSIRFDDEFVRFGLYRNFHDAYEREWKGGNSRWDLLDALRLMHALRPEGIKWRQREDGKGTSFKLEHLAEDNGLREGMAHEALSDVRALIGIARLFRTHQTRLWDYALRLRDKRFAASLMDPVAMTPLLHISQRYPASRMCAAPVIPLARHPQIDSRIIVFDLDSEPDALLDLDADGIADRLYVRQADLPEGELRIPLKEVHCNKCPALVAWEHLREADFERLAIDPVAVVKRAERIRAAGPALAEKMRQVFARDRPRDPVDADAALYDGFIGDADKRLFASVRSSPPHLLAKQSCGFRDPRLPDLLFRYRARNWPESLLPAEHLLWNDYRRKRLEIDNGLAELTFEQSRQQIAELRIAHSTDGSKQVLLDALEAWGQEVEANLA
ncbi:MAG: exodeoxyribonuclease I, partial [Pseudomonadota bacterium]|nr:exodeoxyribonuclease I [Pseudomonadota bacterium]